MREGPSGHGTFYNVNKFIAGIATLPFAVVGQTRIDRNYLIGLAGAYFIKESQDEKHIKKRRARLTELQKHPERRLRLDLTRLRQIINYEEFRCSPNSSVAVNLAKVGSDIDGGLVIVDQEIGLDKELVFVDELKRQGFNVYHPRLRQVEDGILNSIVFSTRAELENIVQKQIKQGDPYFDASVATWNSAMIIYLAGAVIG